MNLKRNLIIFTALLIALYLSLSNPSEQTCLNRVSHDYQKYHLDMEIPVEVLQQVGKSNRSNYLLFSTYQYQYGSIQVHYIGIADSIYYIGIERIKKRSRSIKVV